MDCYKFLEILRDESFDMERAGYEYRREICRHFESCLSCQFEAIEIGREAVAKASPELLEAVQALILRDRRDDISRN